MSTEWHRLIALAKGDAEVLDLEAEAERFPPYVTEYLSALERTERLGLKAAPRIMVRKDCLDIPKLMPIMLRYFSWYQARLMGRTLTIHSDIQQAILDVTGIPCILTTGWMEREGREIFRHDEEIYGRFLRDKKAAYAREGLPFHVWLTSPAFEILDLTYAMNLGWAQNEMKCANLIVYQPLQQVPGQNVYHPMLLGLDFYEKTGATAEQTIHKAPKSIN